MYLYYGTQGGPAKMRMSQYPVSTLMDIAQYWQRMCHIEGKREGATYTFYTPHMDPIVENLEMEEVATHLFTHLGCLQPDCEMRYHYYSGYVLVVRIDREGHYMAYMRENKRTPDAVMVWTDQVATYMGCRVEGDQITAVAIPSLKDACLDILNSMENVTCTHKKKRVLDPKAHINQTLNTLRAFNTMCYNGINPQSGVERSFDLGNNYDNFLLRAWDHIGEEKTGDCFFANYLT